MNSVWIVWFTVDNEGHPKCCGVYATERVAREHMEDLSDVYNVTEHPDTVLSVREHPIYRD